MEVFAGRLARRWAPDLVLAAADQLGDWRRACENLHAAFDRWSRAPRADRTTAYRDYYRALVEEEEMAMIYERLLAEAERLMVSEAAALASSPLGGSDGVWVEGRDGAVHLAGAEGEVRARDGRLGLPGPFDCSRDETPTSQTLRRTPRNQRRI